MSADGDDGRPPLHVLHVGKTGGTALNKVLLEHQDTLRFRPVFGGHEARLDAIPAGERFMFFIRDPLSRFVSAFNSRLREGRPRYHYPWREEEREAFAAFETPDQLATALSSSKRRERKRAESAMRGIGHLNTPYSYWFGAEADFRARLADVFFIGFQERLDDDFDVLKARLGLPAEAELPRGDEAHRAPEGLDSHLGTTARANLEGWYADDIEFVRLCRELAPSVNASDVERRAMPALTRFVPAIGRDVVLRPGSTDELVLKDTFVRLFHVPPDEIRPASVLDLGCNIGLTVAHYELLWPEAEIVGVELDVGNCELARRNCRRARIVHAAVAGTAGTRAYGGDEEWSFRVDPAGNRSVEARPLGELLDLFKTERVDFVKMDIEGSEWEVVERAGDWAGRVGSLLVEVHTPTDKEAAVDSMIGSLEAVGFTCSRHEVHWSAIWATRAS